MIIYAFAAELTEALRVRGLNSRCWPESVNDCQEVQMTFSVDKVRADFPVLSREVKVCRWLISTVPPVRRNQAR